MLEATNATNDPIIESKKTTISAKPKRTYKAIPPYCNASFPSEVNKNTKTQPIRLYVNIEKKAYFSEPLPIVFPINIPTITAPIIPPYVGFNPKNSKNPNNTSPTNIPINNKLLVFMMSHPKYDENHRN